MISLLVVLLASSSQPKAASIELKPFVRELAAAAPLRFASLKTAGTPDLKPSVRQLASFPRNAFMMCYVQKNDPAVRNRADVECQVNTDVGAKLLPAIKSALPSGSHAKAQASAALAKVKPYSVLSSYELAGGGELDFTSDGAGGYAVWVLSSR